jgi:hypothetical protein
MKLDRIICSLLFDIFVLIKFRKLNKASLTSDLSGVFIAGVRRKGVSLSCDYEIFYKEGLAFREAGISSILNNKYNPNEYVIYRGFEGVRYMGYGFWNGFSLAFGINKLLKHRWAVESENEEALGLMMDGEGFSSILFTPEGKLQRAINGIRVKDEGSACRAIGCGRALWWKFLEGSEFDITQSKSSRALLCGMVLASCFTQVRSRSLVDSTISSFIEKYPKSENDIRRCRETSLRMLSEQSAELSQFIAKAYGPLGSNARPYGELSRDLFSVGK